MAVKDRRTMQEKIDAERSLAATADRIDGIEAEASEVTVGSKFQFVAAERALILSVLSDCDRTAKALSRGMQALECSTLNLDALRSACALITEKVQFADDDRDIIELDYKLRKALGTALSIHARKLAKIAGKTLPDLMVDTSDVEDARDRTQRIANKIGEQLTMHLESEDDE